MATVFSTRFIAVHDQPVAIPATYLVPAGFVAVVRDVDAYFGSSLSVKTVFARGSAAQIFWQETVGANLAGWRQWEGRQVIYAGETLSLFADELVDLTASGYLLTLP